MNKHADNNTGSGSSSQGLLSIQRLNQWAVGLILVLTGLVLAQGLFPA
ncbi:MAG: hypothetical protein R3208_11875 [Ketobacteraceae bacterium]|nr:hypothetical protein [Ketobacteraceae bacterium]